MKLRIARKLLFGRSSLGHRYFDLYQKARIVYLRHLHHLKIDNETM